MQQQADSKPLTTFPARRSGSEQYSLIPRLFKIIFCIFLYKKNGLLKAAIGGDSLIKEQQWYFGGD